MLTYEAMRQRKWGGFPVLRKALENQDIPERYFGITSVSDNRFEDLQRLVETSVLAREFRSSIQETAQSQGRYEMFENLQLLIRELEGASASLQGMADEIQSICNEVCR